MRVNPREFGFVGSSALGLALVTSIPYALGHVISRSGSRFNGNLVFDADMNSYFAFVRQSAAGQWLFHNAMTPEPHQPVFFNLEWLVVGKLASLLGNSVELAFQVERLVSIFLLCFGLYWLCCFLFSTVLMRRLVFAAVSLGGGFGWLLYVPGLGGRLPETAFLDTYAGIHPFFWMLLQPHFLIAQALAVFTLCFILRAESRGTASDYVLAALCCVLAGSMRPFEMLYLVAAIFSYILVRTVREGASRSPSRLLLRSLVLLVPLPLLLYYVWLFTVHPVFRWWGVQNIAPPPGVPNLVASLGLAVILLTVGLGKLLESGKLPPPHLLIVCCFVASLALIYSYPLLTFTFQFTTTLLIPTVLLGAMTLEMRLVSWARRFHWSP